MTAAPVGFCSSPRFADHVTGPHHPERPDRIRAVHRAVRDAGLITSPDPFPDFKLDTGIAPVGGEPFVELAPHPIDPQLLTLVHTPAEIDLVRRVCASGGGVLDQGDTPVGPASYDVALLAAGAVLQCCDAVMASRVTRAFAAVRPPGHHAEPDRPMGFCLFNNVALAARYLQRAHGLQRVAIVDFDVHHGNGTQAAFEDDPTVLFISIHQHPRTCYPGTGYDYEVGAGPGRGHTLNLPVSPGSDDTVYRHLFDSKLLPKLDHFRPEFLLISAGFDAHAEDPLAQIELTDDAYEWMTRDLVSAASRHCAGRVVSALEGGYNLRALARSVVRHLAALRRNDE